jgi:hypothetical protein
VAPQRLQHALLRPRRDEHHDVASDDRHVERVLLQPQGAQVCHDPARTGMVLLGCCDQHRIGVDADDRVPPFVQHRPQPSRSAPGVEHP